eukprot:7653658-Lingulodinium_polyedra.AAC.1
MDEGFAVWFLCTLALLGAPDSKPMFVDVAVQVLPRLRAQVFGSYSGHWEVMLVARARGLPVPRPPRGVPS